MRLDRRGIGVLAAGICTFLNLYAPQAMLPELADAFGVSRPRTGLTITASLLAVALVAPFVGSISDVLGRKRLIVAACFALPVPTLLIAQSASLEAMLVWRFAQGLLLPFIFAVTVAYIGDECEGPAGIRIAGTYTLGTIFAGFAGRFIAGFAAEYLGWRAAFVVLAGLTLLGGCAVAAALPPERNFRPQTGGWRGTFATYAGHLANRRLLATCLVGFGMLFSVVATFTFVNFYLAAPPFLLAPTQLGSVFVVYLLGMVTTSVATRLALRIGRRGTLIAGMGVSGIGLMLTLLPSIAAVIAGLALACGGLFVAQSLSLGFIGAIVRTGKSSAVGLYVTIFYIGGSLGGLVPGPLWQAFGWPGVVGVIVAMLAVMAASAGLYWREPVRAS